MSQSITGRVPEYAGGLIFVAQSQSRASIDAQGNFSVPVQSNPATQMVTLTAPQGSPYAPLSLSVALTSGTTNISAQAAGSITAVGIFLGVMNAGSIATDARGYAIPGSGGGGGGFPPADYNVTTPNTFTFPAALTVQTNAGDVSLNSVNINTVSTANTNLTSEGDMNLASGGSLDIQCSGNGAMIISTNNGNLTITGGASGDALDITAPSIGANLSINCANNLSIDAGNILEISGSPINIDGQVNMAAGNSTALTVLQGAAQSANLVSFADHSGIFVSGVNKTGDLVLSATSGAPSDAPVARTMRFDAATGTLYIYNGTAWKSAVLV